MLCPPCAGPSRPQTSQAVGQQQDAAAWTLSCSCRGSCSVAGARTKPCDLSQQQQHGRTNPCSQHKRRQRPASSCRQQQRTLFERQQQQQSITSHRQQHSIYTWDLSTSGCGTFRRQCFRQDQSWSSSRTGGTVQFEACLRADLHVAFPGRAPVCLHVFAADLRLGVQRRIDKSCQTHFQVW